MDRIPSTVDPRDFIGEKLKEIEHARNRDDDRIPQHFERLIHRRERDPMEMNGEAGRENREVKINSRDASQAERHAEKIEFFHAKIIYLRKLMSRAELSRCSTSAEIKRSAVLDRRCSRFAAGRGGLYTSRHARYSSRSRKARFREKPADDPR